ncbi:MAG: AbrB/MazE/SpoVT family DNA-binding domain-containing protein [Thermanaeromonas sp.]|uniref:AbrB/MazE/SpoVT family DNA-binding domain-containing protein n=1 Tax=Thermanaeromonas sp. TaxID=2003697 RepID=UPI00243E4756|nr:AbrB/MazE/SpoVT family DNA-binding domain-containing protein [Thermanaeromonas sp.]MCG0279048.1 AbrB/MazE/SpoVT family DNA-binding domain-containing protein [Thermanaeromonas sp.]
MYKVTISEKGQIYIPVALRRRYGLKKGDKLVLEEIEGAIVLRPLPRHPLLALRGRLKGEEEEKLTDLLLKERAADRERE